MTDADLVLGYLNPVALLGGALPVDVDRARAAIETRIAGRSVSTSPRRRRHRGRRQRQHGRRAAHRVGRARLRPARVHAGRLRRRRARPRGAAGARSWRSARSWCRRSPGASPRWASWRATSVATTRGRSTRRSAAAHSRRSPRRTRPWRPPPGPCWRAPACRPARRELARSADLRYRRQAYELTVPVAPGPSPRDAGAPGRGLPRSAPHDLWPREPGRAGPARQSPRLRGRPAGRPRPRGAGAGTALRRRRPSREARARAGLLQGDRARALRRAVPRRARPRGRAARPSHRGGDGHDDRGPAGLAPARRGPAASSCWRRQAHA